MTTTITSPNVTGLNDRGGLAKVGGSTPVTPVIDGATQNTTPKPGIISSNSVLGEKNTGDARVQAGAALMSDPNSYGGLTPGQTAYTNLQFQNQQGYQNDQKDVLKAINLKYDTSLASSNQQYASLLNDLKTNYQNDTEIATQQAAALNPYSQAAGAETAQNFNKAIRDKYQIQVSKTEEQARSAEAALRSGQTESYISLTNSMKEGNRSFQENMAKFLLDSNQQNTQNKQWQQSFGLSKDTFDFNKNTTANSQFMDMVNTFGADPKLKSDLHNFSTTGNITESLLPIIEKGKAAGYSADEALALANHQTLQQAQFQQTKDQFAQTMNLGWFNANTSRITANNNAGMNGGISPNGYINTDPSVKKALTNAIAIKGITPQLRNAAIAQFDQYGLAGAYTFSYNNMMSDTKKKSYDTNATAAQTLQSVADNAKYAQTGAGPYKNAAESAKPWLLLASDQDYKALQQTIGQVQAQIRTGDFGTALSKYEQQNSDQFLINKNDSITSIQTKASNLAKILNYTKDYTAAISLGIQDSVKLEDYGVYTGSHTGYVAPTASFGAPSAPLQPGYSGKVGSGITFTIQ